MAPFFFDLYTFTNYPTVIAIRQVNHLQNTLSPMTHRPIKKNRVN